MISKITHKIAGLAACILLLSACGGRGGVELAQATVLEPASGEAAFTQKMRNDLTSWEASLNNQLQEYVRLMAPVKDFPQACFPLDSSLCLDNDEYQTFLINYRLKEPGLRSTRYNLPDCGASKVCSATRGELQSKFVILWNRAQVNARPEGVE